MPNSPRSSRYRYAFCLGVLLLSNGVHADNAGRITVVGSSTVYPFAAKVAEVFGSTGKWKTPVIESTGTGGGFKMFCRGVGIGTPDINSASRPITDDERAMCAKNGVRSIVGIRIGSDGIIIASGKRSTPFDVTRDQLYRAVAQNVVLNGKLVANPYRRWNEIDPTLPNRLIVIFGPAPNHGTRDAFAALVLAPACERVPEITAMSKDEQKRACQTVREDGAWIDVTGDYSILLKKLSDDPVAVAVLTFSYLDQNHDRIQAAKVDGISPTRESIGAWKYPIARPLFIYVKAAHVGSVPGLAEFVQEFVSDKAAGKEGYLADQGLGPTPSAWLSVEQGKAAALTAGRR